MADEHAIETYRSMITVGIEGLKALQLINGGAVVALLAYLGQAQDRATLAPLFARPLWVLLSGLTVGTLAFVGTYLTQLTLFNETQGRSGVTGTSHGAWLIATICLSLISLACFATGAFLALGAFAAT